MKSPCIKECPKRSITCHSNCKEYSEWVTEEKAKKNKIRASKEGASQFMDYKSDVRKRVYKQKGKEI